MYCGDIRFGIDEILDCEVPYMEYEIIKCRINRKTVKTRQTFSVSGRYSNGNFYNGTFVEKSIGKTVFILEEDAIKMRDKLNSKRF